MRTARERFLLLTLLIVVACGDAVVLLMPDGAWPDGPMSAGLQALAAACLAVTAAAAVLVPVMAVSARSDRASAGRSDTASEDGE